MPCEVVIYNVVKNVCNTRINFKYSVVSVVFMQDTVNQYGVNEFQKTPELISCSILNLESFTYYNVLLAIFLTNFSIFLHSLLHDMSIS